MAKPGFRLALFATLLALIVVLLGAYTRLTHASRLTASAGVLNCGGVRRSGQGNQPRLTSSQSPEA